MRILVRSAVVAGVLAAGAGPVHAAADPAPNPIHVDVSADVPDPQSGDVVTYTVRIQNDSPNAYPHMNVFQLLPAGFHVTETTPKARAAATGPEWTVDVPAGGGVDLSATVTAGSVAEADHIPRTTTRPRSTAADGAGTGGKPGGGASTAAPAPRATTTFTTTACVRDAAVGPALACGSAKQTLSDSPDGAGGSTKWRPGLLGLGFAAALAAGLRGYVRKRGVRRAGRDG